MGVPRREFLSLPLGEALDLVACAQIARYGARENRAWLSEDGEVIISGAGFEIDGLD